MKKYDIALVSGGFDPVHIGHLKMFQCKANIRKSGIALK